MNEDAEVDVERMVKNLSINNARAIPISQLKLNVEICRGCYGTIWRASWNTRSTIPVAVKVCEQMQSMQNFFKEAEILQNLEHEAIVKFYGIADIPSTILNQKLLRPCVVVELMNDGSLEHVLHENRAITISQADVINWANQIARGIKYMHSLNIVHRNITPQSLLINDNRQTIKIADFGITRKLTTNLSIPYTAPETFTQKIYKKPSDVYSFGITLWEMVTRTRPYSNIKDVMGSNSLDYLIVMLVANNKLRPAMDDAIPMPIKSLLSRCWYGNALHRPTISDIVNEFNNWGKQKPIPIVPLDERKNTSIHARPIRPVDTILGRTVIDMPVATIKTTIDHRKFTEEEANFRRIATDRSRSEEERMMAVIQLASIWGPNINWSQLQFIRSIIENSNDHIEVSFNFAEISTQSYEQRIQLIDSIELCAQNCADGDWLWHYVSLIYQCFIHRSDAFDNRTKPNDYDRQIRAQICTFIMEKMRFILSDAIWTRADWSSVAHRITILSYFTQLLIAYRMERSVDNLQKFKKHDLRLLRARLDEPMQRDPSNLFMQEIANGIRQIHVAVDVYFQMKFLHQLHMQNKTRIV